MSRGINKVILIGNCGQDPETRYTASGSAITNVSIATSESWKDKQTGQMQERTEWHRVVFFNRLGEIAGEYLKKGVKVYIEGSLRTNKWKDQQGQDRYSTDIVASEMQMLDSRETSQQGNQGYMGGGPNPHPGMTPQQHQQIDVPTVTPRDTPGNAPSALNSQQNAPVHVQNGAAQSQQDVPAQNVVASHSNQPLGRDDYDGEMDGFSDDIPF